MNFPPKEATDELCLKALIAGFLLEAVEKVGFIPTVPVLISCEEAGILMDMLAILDSSSEKAAKA